MNCLQVFQKFLKTQNLHDQKLMLAVSGGVDSMVLLDVATKSVAPENLAVFHLDHNARESSGADRQLVEKACQAHNLKFYTDTLQDISSKNQESVWRKARQNQSQKAADNFSAVRILTAHHATDLAETMIFRLTKGCGPTGLSPFDTTTKPFWNIPKTDLIDYAQQNKLTWQEDPSNADLDFERNLIRHEVLPHLRKITPNLEKVLVAESELFGEVEAFLQSQTPKQTEIKLTEFLALDPIIGKQWLRNQATKTPSSSEIEDCLKWLLGSPEGSSQKEVGGTKLKIESGILKAL